MTQLLQDLVRRATGRGGANTVWLPAGETLLREPLVVNDNRGLQIVGHSMHTSRVVMDFAGYDDSNDFRGPLPLLVFGNCQDTLLSNFRIILTGDIDGAVGYWRAHEGAPTPTNNHHEHITVIGRAEGHGGKAGYGIAFRTPEKDRPNNEASYTHDCHFFDCNIWFLIEGSQSKEHVMDHCRGGGGAHAVDSTGSFWWRGGGGSGLSDAAFRLREPVDTIRIDYPAFEASLRLLHASGPAGYHGDGQPTLITGGRFMCDQLHSDGAAIIMDSQGPLTVQNFIFGSGDQRTPHIRVHDASIVTMRDVEFASTGAYEQRKFVRYPDGRPATRADAGRPTYDQVYARTETGTRKLVDPIYGYWLPWLPVERCPESAIVASTR